MRPHKVTVKVEYRTHEQIQFCHLLARMEGKIFLNNKSPNFLIENLKIKIRILQSNICHKACNFMGYHIPICKKLRISLKRDMNKMQSSLHEAKIFFTKLKSVV